MNQIEPRKVMLPFEQQAREGNKAYAAFRLYLDLGAQRSLAAVGGKLGKSESLIERWSSKYDWHLRVQAYGAHLAELERKAIEGKAVEKAVEWEKTHESVKREAWQEAELTIAMVRKARAEWMEKGRVPGWEGMARMLELAFKLKQFASGLPSEFKQVEANLTATIEVDWEIALRKAYGQAVPNPEPPKAEPPKAVVIDVEVVQPPEVGGQKTEDSKTETEMKP